MPTILREFQVTAPFRYLWLKYVTGVDLSVHCARSLLGEYEPAVGVRPGTIRDLRLKPAPYCYLCGVAMPYQWSANFHLAWREKEGAILAADRLGVRVVIENAEEIAFGFGDVDPAHPHARHKSYFTCRNWQFAHWLAKHEGWGGE